MIDSWRDASAGPSRGAEQSAKKVMGNAGYVKIQDRWQPITDRVARPRRSALLDLLKICKVLSSAPPLKISRSNDILVSMTRLTKSKALKARKPRRRRGRQPGHWLLQDAKARFSELVRRVRTEGPQHVTVHGRDEVVVIAADEFKRLKGDLTGQALVAAMQASPYREIDLEPARSRLPVRDVDL